MEYSAQIKRTNHPLKILMVDSDDSCFSLNESRGSLSFFKGVGSSFVLFCWEGFIDMAELPTLKTLPPDVWMSLSEAKFNAW